MFLGTFDAICQDHMTFKNIPINGSVSEFCKKLTDNGFVLDKKEKGYASLTGKFVNQECEILVLGSAKSDLTWKVVAYLPEKTSWGNLKSQYFDLKAQFTAKYGEGKAYEFFSDPYYEGDGYEIQALKKEKCTYVTFWKVDNGNISLEISKYSQVAISYEDKENYAIRENERESIINDDI
ncbi:hypothetical protein D0T49_10710 [Paludibacter sp. 221]|nr:hypothetical protein [Paludibacter sp. 221]